MLLDLSRFAPLSITLDSNPAMFGSVKFISPFVQVRKKALMESAQQRLMYTIVVRLVGYLVSDSPPVSPGCSLERRIGWHCVEHKVDQLCWTGED